MTGSEAQAEQVLQRCCLSLKVRVERLGGHLRRVTGLWQPAQPELPVAVALRAEEKPNFWGLKMPIGHRQRTVQHSPQWVLAISSWSPSTFYW